MDFFTAFALILTISLLASSYKRDKLVDATAYGKAVKFFIIAVLVRYPIIDSISREPGGIARLIWFGASLASYILVLLSFRSLCVSWGAPLPKGGSEEMRRGL